MEEKEEFILLENFELNEQLVDNLGLKEMVSGNIAGIHHFCKQADVFFQDKNQFDEFTLGDKVCKIFVRGAQSDSDILIPDKLFNNRKDIDIFMCLKKKANKYIYVGYIERSVVEKTRVISMIGTESGDTEGGAIRRIFAEQYLPMSNLLPIKVKKIKEAEIEQQKICHYNIHTEYSLGKAFGTIPYITNVLKRKGIKTAAISDYFTMGGLYSFQKYMLEKECNPVLGCKFDVLHNKYTGTLTLLIKNEKGWKNILSLQNIAVRENFYYHPRIAFSDLRAHSEGLIVLTADEYGLLNQMILKDDFKEFDLTAQELLESFGDDLIFEIFPTTNVLMSPLYEYLYKESGFKERCMFSMNILFPKETDEDNFLAMLAINKRKKFSQVVCSEKYSYLLNDEEVELCVKGTWIETELQQLLKLNHTLKDRINFKIIPCKREDTLPIFDSFNNDELQRDSNMPLFKELLKELKPTNKDFFLCKLAYDGLMNRDLMENKEYLDRVDLELHRIIRKEYSNYFLAVWDYVQYCNKNGIMVGPGRGSVGGSLVAFLIDITTVDPIKHDLLFDRFISDIRRDAPDIDLDFMDKRRPEVFQYLKNKYGEERCAKVITYSTFHPKGILRDIGRIFDIPILEIENICSVVFERSGGDARSSFSLVDTFDEFPKANEFREKYPKPSAIAIALEGHIRHKGIHAAAMIVSDTKVSDYVPVDKVNNEITTSWAKSQCEEMKLIKFDILGLKTLSVIKDAIDFINLDNDNIKLPEDFEDIDVYDNIFKKGNNLGVFQFETVGLSKLSREIGTKNFPELYDCTSLFRPGPLHSGQTQIYINRAKGLEEPTPFHSKLYDITKDTKGIIIYQEQTMKIMNQVGHMSWAAAETVRKIITKSKGEHAFEDMRKEFTKNAHEKSDMTEEEARELFDVVSTFGSYGFNKSHAVEYTIISYWCAWLKYYYPAYFFAALLKNEEETDQERVYLEDAKRNGVDIKAPDVNRSKEDYSICDNKIYAGFKTINGIADKTASKIISNQPYTSFEDFKKRAKVSSNVLKGLVVSGALDEFKINKKNILEGNGDIYSKENDYSDIELSELLYSNTNLIPTLSVTEIYDFVDFNYVNINEAKEYGGEIIMIRGVATIVLNKDKLLNSMTNTLGKHKHQFERHMYYVNMNDGTGDIAVQINPHMYELYKDNIKDLKGKPLMFLGKLNKDGTKLYGSVMQILNETYDIEKIQKNIKEGKECILYAVPCVSKKEKSYYNICTSKFNEGMLFQFEDEKIFPGLIIKKVRVNEPFIKFEIEK